MVLCKNGSLNVDLTISNSSFVYTFPYDYDDGYRHYVQFTFRGRRPLSVTVSPNCAVLNKYCPLKHLVPV